LTKQLAAQQQDDWQDDGNNKSTFHLASFPASYVTRVSSETFFDSSGDALDAASLHLGSTQRLHTRTETYRNQSAENDSLPPLIH
jgi:hypothetical protein